MKNIFKSFTNTLLFAAIIASVMVVAYGANPAIALVASYIGVELFSLIAPKGVVGADVYADTVLQAARAFLKDENNKKFQLRPNFTKILNVFLKDREYTIPALSSIKQATTQTTTAMYLKRKDFTISTSKTCEPTGEQSGSGKVDLTWVQKGFKIYTSFKQHAGNEVNMGRALANDLYNAEASFWTRSSGIDAALLTYLEANKSGVNNGSSGTFDSANDIMWVSNANKNRFYNLVTADMQMNNYMPIYNEVHNTAWTAEQQYYINQGAGNSVNTQFQFAGFEFMPSNLITPGTIGSNTYGSIHYIVPDGGVAILDWNDPLNRAGKVSGNKSWGTFQSIFHPEFTFDLFKVSDCADTTSDGGATQDYTEVWEFTLNYALAKQPISVSTEEAIFKYGIADDSTFVS